MGDATRRQTVRIHAASQPPNLTDRFGRPLVVGGQYELHDPLPAVFEITEITPDLSAFAQPGVWMIRLRAELALPLQSGTRAMLLTLVQLPKAFVEQATAEATGQAIAQATIVSAPSSPDGRQDTDSPAVVADPLAGTSAGDPLAQSDDDRRSDR
jgi:hypothetical protein